MIDGIFEVVGIVLTTVVMALVVGSAMGLVLGAITDPNDPPG